MKYKTELQRELEIYITGGWTLSDRKRYLEYLETDILPHFPRLYGLLIWDSPLDKGRVKGKEI